MPRARAAVFLMILFVAIGAQCVAVCSVGVCAKPAINHTSQDETHSSSPCHHHKGGKPPESGNTKSQHCSTAQTIFARSSGDVLTAPSPRAVLAVGEVSPQAVEPSFTVASRTLSDSSPPLVSLSSSITILRV